MYGAATTTPLTTTTLPFEPISRPRSGADWDGVREETTSLMTFEAHKVPSNEAAATRSLSNAGDRQDGSRSTDYGRYPASPAYQPGEQRFLPRAMARTRRSEPRQSSDDGAERPLIPGDALQRWEGVSTQAVRRFWA